VSIRIRQTAGTSWPGCQPGVRHWQSASVSYGLWGCGLGLFGAAIWYLVIWPFLLGPLWLTAEFYLLGATGALVLYDWWTDERTRYDLHWRRAWVFWYLSVV
jgi:hypothetical protein